MIGQATQFKRLSIFNLSDSNLKAFYVLSFKVVKEVGFKRICGCGQVNSVTLGVVYNNESNWT